MGRGTVVFSVNIPAAGEAEHLAAEHSSCEGGGKSEANIRVSPNGVRFRVGFKSSIEIKCWAEKLDRGLDVRIEPMDGEGEHQKQG